MVRPLSLLIAAAAVGVLSLGTWWLHARAAVEPTVSPVVATVATAPVRLEDHVLRQARYAGRIEPARMTTLAFEQAGRVTTLLVDEGAEVGGGDVVALLDTRLRRAERERLVAERRALDARLALALRTEERQSALEGRGFSATQALDEARFARSSLEAEAAAIEASIARLDVELDQAVLRAPFAGTVGARHVDEGATVATGTPVLDLLETGRPQARIGLPPELADRLAIGASAVLEVGGQQLDARVAARRVDVDGRTRTTQVLFDLEGPTPAFGALVSLVVDERIEARGFWVPTAMLETSTKGLFQVPLAVREADGWRRGFAAVALVHAETERAFVTGVVPEGARLMMAGAHRLPVGVPVRPNSE